MEGILDEYLARICIEKKWDVWVKNRPKIDFILRKINPYIKTGDRICEIGIGDGYLLDRLNGSGIDCTGIDISNYLIEYHKKRAADKGMKTEFIQGNIINAVLRPLQFNVIFCIDIIEHLTEEESVSALEKIYGILRPGGVVAASFPYNENLYASMTKCPQCGNEFHKVGHRQSLDFQKIKNMFEPAFKIEEIGEIDWNLCENTPFYKRGVTIEGFIRRIHKIFTSQFINKQDKKIDIAAGGTCYLIAKKHERNF